MQLVEHPPEWLRPGVPDQLARLLRDIETQSWVSHVALHASDQGKVVAQIESQGKLCFIVLDGQNPPWAVPMPS